jgi:hypothetical protein
MNIIKGVLQWDNAGTLRARPLGEGNMTRMVDGSEGWTDDAPRQNNYFLIRASSELPANKPYELPTLSLRPLSK